MGSVGDYVRARSLDDVLAAFHPARSAMQHRVIAGGTDLLAKLGRSATEPAVVAVDVSNVPELGRIEVTGGGLCIGAATRLADVACSDALTGAWQVLADGAAKVGSPQIRNLATLGGNVCNASPAADTIPPLLILDAEAEIVSIRGRRVVALRDFFTGPGKTVLEPDEILAYLRIPAPPSGAAATYLKHSPRRAMDLAVVGVAVWLAPLAGHLEPRIAVGAVAPTPRRCGRAEEMLNTRTKPAAASSPHQWELTLTDDEIAIAARLAAEDSAPISDIRASADYRRQMVRVLTERALRQTLDALSQGAGRTTVC